MNIRDLQYLVAVHDLNNFSKAAERCYVSQPTLSGQLKKLEDELGSELIERSTRQVLFTQLGEEVVRYAREALQTVEQIRSVAKQSMNPMQGDFHIGLIPTVGPFLLPLIMPELSARYPKSNLFLYELRTEELIEKLLKGEIDAAILAKLDWDYPVAQTDLYEEPMQLAVSTSDAVLMNEESVSLDVLDDREVLMLEDGHCLRNQALDVCFSAGAKEDQRFKATSMDTLLHMVATGTGMTLIPELATRSQVQGIRFLKFNDPVPKREVVMLTRKNSARMLALDNIANTVIETINRVKH
ncbi:MAG: DNA-binding transcriptional regulator OxyR [Acidiferrobacterales bacterium]|nr:DNA-binding transcriptional regulator OxyR [Acidiferrobacterales bacterium]